MDGKRYKNCEVEGHHQFEKMVIGNVYEWSELARYREKQKEPKKKKPVLPATQLFYPNQNNFQPFQLNAIRHPPEENLVLKKKTQKEKEQLNQLSKLKLICLKCYLDLRDFRQARGIYTVVDAGIYFSHPRIFGFHKNQRMFLSDLLIDPIKPTIDSKKLLLQKQYAFIHSSKQKFKHEIGTIINTKSAELIKFLIYLRAQLKKNTHLNSDENPSLAITSHEFYGNRSIAEIQAEYQNFLRTGNKQAFELRIKEILPNINEARKKFQANLSSSSKSRRIKTLQSIQVYLHILINNIGLKHFKDTNCLSLFVPKQYSYGMKEITRGAHFIFRNPNFDKLSCTVSECPLVLSPHYKYKYYYEMSLLDWNDVEKLDKCNIQFCLIGEQGFVYCQQNLEEYDDAMPPQTAKWRVDHNFLGIMRNKFLQKQSIEIMIEVTEKPTTFGGMHCVYYVEEGAEKLIKRLNIMAYQKKYNCSYVYPLLAIQGISMQVVLLRSQLIHKFDITNQPDNYSPFNPDMSATIM